MTYVSLGCLFIFRVHELQGCTNMYKEVHSSYKPCLSLVLEYVYVVVTQHVFSCFLLSNFTSGHYLKNLIYMWSVCYFTKRMYNVAQITCHMGQRNFSPRGYSKFPNRSSKYGQESRSARGRPIRPQYSQG